MIIRDDHIYTCDTEIETEDYYRVRAEIKAEIKALNAG